MFGLNPNIEGELGPFRMWATKVDPQSGALSAETRGKCNWSTGNGDLTLNVLLNASESDNTYAGSKVQTAALQVLCCIKT